MRRDPETPAHLERDRIMVDGRAIEAQQKIYLMMNKPRGLVTTASDEKGRDTVYSLLAKAGESLPWVAPVGRLDKASEGLLLLTNDSEWGARVAAPETHLEKTYHVQIGALADEKFIRHTGRAGEDRRWRSPARSTGARCCVPAKRTAGLRSLSTKARTARFAACWRRLKWKYSGWCEWRSARCNSASWRRERYRPLTAEEKEALDRAMKRRQLTNHKGHEGTTNEICSFPSCTSYTS